MRSRRSAGREQDAKSLAKYKSSYEDLLAVSRARDAQHTQLQKDVAARDTQLKTCQAHNAELYRVGHEILDAYEHVGLGTLFSSRQPFAQSARVKYDDIAQRYGDALYAGSTTRRRGRLRQRRRQHRRRVPRRTRSERATRSRD